MGTETGTKDIEALRPRAALGPLWPALPLPGSLSTRLAAVNIPPMVADVAAQLLALVTAHRAPLGLAAALITTIGALANLALTLRRRHLLPALAIGRLLRPRPRRGQSEGAQQGGDDVGVHGLSFAAKRRFKKHPMACYPGRPDFARTKYKDSPSSLTTFLAKIPYQGLVCSVDDAW